ncbi:MAG TPA: CBS domain-containing protein [Acidimicrobiales bacterium]|jgi:CBS domain-containing protein|nr:CBS domain-containing protein [Acidimicrobiales bacterium]
MAERPFYVSRILRLPLVSADGANIGKVDDIVFVPGSVGPPRVIGFVAVVQRRRIFVNAARVGELSPLGVRLRSGNIDVRHFQQRSGEMRARELLDRRVANDFVVDLAIESITGQPSAWQLATVALGRRSRLRGRRNPRIVPWTQVPELFTAAPMAIQAALLRELHPSDAAQRVRDMPQLRRQQLTDVMEDEHLAEVLQELTEDEQVSIIGELDVERAASVIEYMEPDDAADLLGEMSEDDRIEILEAMDDEEATPLRRLLTYEKSTAGGLMTSDPLVLLGVATVADALAVMRDSDLEIALASQVFITEPPTSTPTGRFLGAVGFQRLLREPPWARLDSCVDDEPEYITPELPDDEVAARLAAYDLVAIAVCDAARRLVGAVTVDDVIDHMLPPTWRRARRGARA